VNQNSASVRIGQNPQKESGAVNVPWTSRVVLPVHIPHRQGYFEQALEVLRLCLESLHLTTNQQVCVTVVANGCSNEVLVELQAMFQRRWIGQLLVSQINLGKVGAIAPILRGATEELLAWSDCDVLFRPGWFEAVQEVFQAFPECGAVTPFPAAHLHWEHTSATTLGALGSRCIAREPVVPVGDLESYSRSVGTPTLFREEYKRSQWTVRRNGVQACIGAMHFVCCIRKGVVKGMPAGASVAALRGKEDTDYLDLPADRLGYWRLSTCRGFVWHMGNTVDPWMIEHVDQMRRNGAKGLRQQGVLPNLRRSWLSRLPLGLRRLGARALRHWLERSILKVLRSKLAASWRSPSTCS